MMAAGSCRRPFLVACVVDMFIKVFLVYKFVLIKPVQNNQIPSEIQKLTTKIFKKTLRMKQLEILVGKVCPNFASVNVEGGAIDGVETRAHLQRFGVARMSVCMRCWTMMVVNAQ
jgi:hypothetical protein